MYGCHAMAASKLTFCEWINEWKVEKQNTGSKSLRNLTRFVRTFSTLIQLRQIIVWTWVFSQLSEAALAITMTYEASIADELCNYRKIKKFSSNRITSLLFQLHDHLWLVDERKHGLKLLLVNAWKEINESKVQRSSYTILFCHYWFFNDH